MNILIAEDNSTIQLLYQDVLSAWGYNFDIAENGREAVELAQKNRGKYDLCLMDVEMPIMNGIEATYKIREDTHYLPIAACTSDPGYEQACMQAGTDDFFTKTLFSTSLKNKIEELTVKRIILYLNKHNVSLEWVGPTNGEELKELRALDKIGQAKYTVVDSSHHLVAHKRTQHKPDQNFKAGIPLLTDSLDGLSKQPGIAHIHAPHMKLNNQRITQEQLIGFVKDENEKAEEYG